MSSFTPHVAPPSQAGPPRKGVLRIPYGPGPQHFGDLRLPASGPRPLVVIVHGGAYRNAYHLDLMDDLAEDLLRRGFASWNIEYRRMGDPGAEWPGLFQDVAAAADRVVAMAPEHGLDLGRVVVLGHSASRMATRSSPARVPCRCMASWPLHRSATSTAASPTGRTSVP